MAIQRVEIHRSRITGNISEMNTCLRVEDNNFQEKIASLRISIDTYLKQLEDHHRRRMNTLQRQTGLLEKKSNELLEAVERIITAEKREDAKKIKELEQRIELMEKNGVGNSLPTLEDSPGADKAKTIAIFDSILFAISNWSSDGQTASDIELVCQSILFPAVYERVMSGQSDYFIEKVPPSAIEIVKRGRELVQHIRSIEESSLLTEASWEKHHSFIQEWVVGDALPLLYGARDPKWDEDDVLSLDEILEWRDQPASRALHFPLIFDGMELVERFRDEIRETTGLPDFTKDTMSTRLEVL